MAAADERRRGGGGVPARAALAASVQLRCEQREAEPLTGAEMKGVPRRAALDALMVAWGLGTWLGVNGLYVQLPLLVQRLPEGWALPASMALAIQLANVGLLAYAGVRRVWARAADAPAIYALLALGTLALALNAGLHERTAVVGGTERSVAFLVLTFCAALVGCTSSVLFYPYLRHFREPYLATYLVGEGLGGLVPALLALVQGVGGEPECVAGADGALQAVHPPPRFGVAAFMALLAALSAVSLTAFALIHGCGAFATERVTPAAAAKDEEARAPRARLLHWRWLAALALTVWLNALSNGVLPSVQSYSCMPYGRRAYHLAVTLAALANPAACLAGVWLPPVPVRALAALLVPPLAPLAYILAAALLSPTPPLLDSASGEALMVVSWVVVSASVSYGRMWVYAWARAGGARGMRAAGAATQAGSALGSALLFALVNYTQLFTQAPDCPAPLAR